MAPYVQGLCAPEQNLLNKITQLTNLDNTLKLRVYKPGAENKGVQASIIPTGPSGCRSEALFGDVAAPQNLVPWGPQRGDAFLQTFTEEISPLRVEICF